MLYDHFPQRTGAREAEGDGLLNRCMGNYLYRGFESLPVRSKPECGSLREAHSGFSRTWRRHSLRSVARWFRCAQPPQDSDPRCARIANRPGPLSTRMWLAARGRSRFFAYMEVTLAPLGHALVSLRSTTAGFGSALRADSEPSRSALNQNVARCARQIPVFCVHGGDTRCARSRVGFAALNHRRIRIRAVRGWRTLPVGSQPECGSLREADPGFLRTWR